MIYRLSDIMDIIGGGTPKTSNPDYWDGDIPWLSVKDFNNDLRYVYNTEKKITKLGLENSSTKFLDRGDMIISARGTVGEIASIPYPMTFNQSCYGLRAKKNIISSDYLYYLIKYNVGKLQKKVHGSVFDTITRETFSDIEVDIPELEIQNKIVSVLCDIDDKIQLNVTINRNLSEQAMTLYKAMILEALEECNEGVLSDIADIVMGQSPKGDTYNEDGVGAVFYQGRAEFGERFPTRRLFTTTPKRMAKENSVLMSVRAPVGDVNVAYEECCIGRGLCSVASKDNHQSFILYTMYSLKDKFDVYNGEGTVFGSINKDSMNSMTIHIPNKTLMDRFEEIVSPMDAVIKANYDENCRLIAVRDSLLPKLMSGELDVSELDI